MLGVFAPVRSNMWVENVIHMLPVYRSGLLGAENSLISCNRLILQFRLVNNNNFVLLPLTLSHVTQLTGNEKVIVRNYIYSIS